MLNKRTGQSTVEYIVLVSAVIAVAGAFFLAPNSKFKTTMNTTLSEAADQIDTMNQRKINSTPTTNGQSPGAFFNTTMNGELCAPPQKIDPATGNCV